MDIVLFIHQDSSENGETLKNIIDKKIINKKPTNTQLHTLKSLDMLKAKLKQFSNYKNKTIFILLADSKIRLKQLTSLIDLMEDKRIILILPDHLKATMAEAPKFFPRFFTDVNDNYNELCGVLNKMIKQKEINIAPMPDGYKKGGHKKRWAQKKDGYKQE